MLAQTAEIAETTEIPVRQIVPVDFLWGQIAALSWLQAIIAISFGVIYLLYGWRIFRVLVVISFGLAGMAIGIRMGSYVGSNLWGGVAGLVLMAVVSVPLMKWCVCILGSVAGGIVTGGIWYACSLPEIYIWAGAAVGAVAGGMISFIVLKLSVMLFTSMGGSVIVSVGVLALMNSYENAQEPVTTHIHDMVYNENWFLPVVLLVPTIIGMITQNKFIKQSHKWEL